MITPEQQRFVDEVHVAARDFAESIAAAKRAGLSVRIDGVEKQCFGVVCELFTVIKPSPAVAARIMGWKYDSELDSEASRPAG
jgi:hypothetical protein